MNPGDTLRVRYESGVESDLDVPTDPYRREIFDDMVAKGQIIVLEGGTEEPEPEPADDDAPPAGTIDEVVAWVGDSPYRAAQALAAEEAGKNRQSLVKTLTAVIESTDVDAEETEA